MRNIGPVIADLRQSRQIQQAELGTRVDKSRQGIGKVERDDSNPQWATVLAIAKALDVNLLEVALLTEGLAPDARSAIDMANEIRSPTDKDREQRIGNKLRLAADILGEPADELG